MAKDYLGNDLFVGDEVVFIAHERTNVGGTESIQFHDQIVKIVKP